MATVSGLINTGTTTLNSTTTIKGPIYFGSAVGSEAYKPILVYSETYPKYGICYNNSSVDKLSFSASGNADSVNADLCINGAGDGTITMRGKQIWNAGNLTKVSQLTNDSGYLTSLPTHNHHSDYMRVVTQNSTFTIDSIPSDLDPGVHKIHISGKEYSSILCGNDYTGAQWQLYFHPHESYDQAIKYRYRDGAWRTLLDSTNSSVSKEGETLTVTINGTSQSLTNSTYNFLGASFTSGQNDTGEHNCNNIKTNGHWYYTSNGPTQALGATTNDGALYTQAYSTSWVTQIAQDYRNGNLYTRSYKGDNSNNIPAGWQPWRKVAYADDAMTPKSHTHTKSEITDFSHTHSFSNITPGNAIIGDGANYMAFRSTATWRSGMYYQTNGDEAMVFANTNPRSSWMFVYDDPANRTVWTNFNGTTQTVPSLQIRNQCVTINKLMPNTGSATSWNYNLDVGGKANATELYENGTRVALSDHKHAYLPLSGGTLNDSAKLKLQLWGTRSLTLSGNSIDLDMSLDTGTYAGAFATIKDSKAAITTMLGFYGSHGNGLYHIFMGGTYDNPAMKMDPSGNFTFKNTITGTITNANAAGTALRLTSPYAYEDNNQQNVITNNTTADSLFSDSYSFSAMMSNHPIWNNYATVWNFSGYTKYGGTQFAVMYNTQPVRAAIRTYTQTGSKWGDWVELLTTANFTNHITLAGLGIETWATNKGFATESYVTNKVAEIITGGTVKLDGYATEEYVNTTFLPKANLSVSGGGSTWESSLTITLNGTATTLTLPANPNTDSNVQQMVTSASNTSWRPLLLGASYSDSTPSTFSTTTSNIYASHIMRVQPNTGSLETSGTISASSFIGTATHATNAFYIKTQYQANSNFYTGYRAWLKWIDGSTLGMKITSADTATDTTASTWQFRADQASKLVISEGSTDKDFYLTLCRGASNVESVHYVSDLYYENSILYCTNFQGVFQGNATSATTASKLSTVSKTAWGQTYWTSGGIPTDISGDITGTYFVIKDATSPYLKFTTSAGKTAVFHVNALSGLISIGPTTSTAVQISTAGAVTLPSTLTVTSNITSSGTISAAGGFYQTSDERLKHFIKDVEIDFDKLKQIPKKYFNWKGQNTNQLCIGTSAQAIQKLYPELVSKDSSGQMSVAYDKLSVIALKGIDELYQLILQLKKENEDLKEIINSIKR